MSSTGLIILEQLKTNRNDLMVWGSTAFKTFSSNFFTDVPHLGGLLFKVSGLKHKSHVMIRLAGNDTYIVETGTLRKGEWKSKEVKTDVYCDELHSVIDDLVEGTKNLSSKEVLKVYQKSNTTFFGF